MDDSSTLVSINKDELLAAIQHDCVTFLSFYLGDKLTLAVPDLHIEIWNELLLMIQTSNQSGAIQQLRKLFAVPRDHAKSTLAKLAVVLFSRYSPFFFTLYVSKTNTIAKNAIRDILEWFNSPQERELYGASPITHKSSETESLWIISIPTRRNAGEAPTFKRLILKALGADQQVRGLNIANERPQIVVIDDIEDTDNTKTPEAQANLDEWFLGPFFKAISKRAVVIFIGNMIRKTTLLARLTKDPSWNPTVYGALVRNKTTGLLEPLWPGRHTVESLLAEYREYRRLGRGYIWEAEMMNLTQDDILMSNMDGTVRASQPLPEMLEAGFITVDPAFGQNSWNDDTGIVVHARIKGYGIPFVVDSKCEKMTEDEIFDNLIEFSYKWGITCWCIEAEAAQKLLIPYFRLLMQSRKMNEGLFMMLPVVSGGTKKASRIVAWRNSVSSGSYGIVWEEQIILDKLIEYLPDAKVHDDHIDSGAYGVTAWQLYGETINSLGIKQVAMLVFGDGEGFSTEIQDELRVAGF